MTWREYGEKIWHFALFSVGATTVTAGSIIIFLLVLLAAIVVARLLTRIFGTRMLSRFNIDEGTRYNLERIAYYLLLGIGAIIAFNIIGISLSGLAVILGLFSVGIGFGLQNVTSNFFAGLILLLERPIRVHDWITIGDTEGDVLAINMRATTVRSIDNIAIIVPNSEFISKQVTNWSYGDKKIRLNIDVGVSYGSNLDAVLRSLKEVALENERVLKTPEPIVLLKDFGDSSWNMRLLCWIDDPREHWKIQSDLKCDIVRKFRAKNIEIPFPQRDLHVKSPLPLPLAGLEKES